MTAGAGSCQKRAIYAALAVLLFVATLTTAVLAQALKTSPSDILANPDRYDRQTVTISGTVTNLRVRVSHAGNSYYTLDLSDGKQAVRVFSFGTATCRAGGATVEGTFEKVKRQGRYTFYNEVTATSVTCR